MEGAMIAKLSLAFGLFLSLAEFSDPANIDG
jgi:hypothetical protein